MYILRRYVLLNMIEHFLFIVSQVVLFFLGGGSRISGSTWCKNCPMFFPKFFQPYYGGLQGSLFVMAV